MIQVTAQTRILVAIEPTDFRRGIDGLARLCRDALGEDAMSGTVFVFRNRRRTAIKALSYDGQGYWLCHKRFSSRCIRYWPGGAGSRTQLEAHELVVLLSGGDPAAAKGAPAWRSVRLPA